MNLKRWSRRLLWLGITLVVLIVIALVALPHVVAGSWGREKIEGILSSELDTPVRLGAVEFGWFSGLVVDGIVIGEGKGFRVRRVTASPELLSLLGDEVRINRVEIEGVDLVVVRARDGNMRVEGWPESEPEPPGEEKATGPTEVPRISGEIVVRDANVTFRDEATRAETTVPDVVVEVTFSPEDPDQSVSISSAPLGFRFNGVLSLLEDGRLREDPSALGDVRFDGLTLERFAGLLPMVEGIDLLEGTVSGDLVVVDLAEDRIETTLEMSFDGVRVKGPAVDGGRRLRGAVNVQGEFSLVAGDLRARDVVVSGAGGTLTSTGMSLVDGRAVAAEVVVEASAASVRAGFPGLVPEDVEGRLELSARLHGTLDEIEASFEARVSDVALPGAPDDLGRLPVTASGTARILEGGHLDVTGSATRGQIALEGRVGIDPDSGPSVEATIRGTATEEDLSPWISSDTLARTGTGPVEIAGHLRAKRVGDDWEIDIRGAGEAENLTITRGGRTLATRWIVSSHEMGFAARGGASLVDADGLPLIEDIPELGAHWRIVGHLEGSLDLESVRAFGIKARLGDGRFDVWDARFEHLLTDHRRGQLRATWKSPLRLQQPDLASRLDLAGRGEGSLTVELEGGRLCVATETTATDLVVCVPDRFELRESRMSLTSNLVIEPDGRVDVDGASIETDHLRASFDGLLNDVLRTPTGSGKILARGDLDALRPWLSTLGPDAPTGSFEASLTTEMREDEIVVFGRLAATTLTVGDRFAADKLNATVDATLLRDANAVVIRGIDAWADQTHAQASGRLDLSGGRPRFVGRIEAAGDLDRIPVDLLPRGTTIQGRGSLEATLGLDGHGTLASRLTEVRLLGLAAIPAIVEPALILSGRFSWPEDRTLPDLEHAEISTLWGGVVLDGHLALDGPSDATLGIDVDLPAFLKAHPSLFPAKSKARGRAAGTIEFAGRLDVPRDATASGRLSVERFTFPGYDLKDGKIDVRLAEGILEIKEAGARLNGGATSVTGSVDLTEDEPVFTGRFATDDLRLAGTMEPVARYASPLFALASELEGKAFVSGDIVSRGLTTEDLVRSLDADVDIRIDEGRVTGSPMLRSLLTLLERGRETPALGFADVRAVLKIADGKLVTEDLRFASESIDIRFRGVTGLLDQSIRYGVRVKLPGREKDLPPLLRALDPEGYIPLRLGGTLTAPTLLPPDPEDVAGNVLEDLLEDLLGGRLKKKDRKKK